MEHYNDIINVQVGMRIKAWHKGGRKWKSAIIVHIHKDNTLKVNLYMILLLFSKSNTIYRYSIKMVKLKVMYC